MLVSALKRGWSAFNRATTAQTKAVLLIFLALFLCLGAWIVESIVSDTDQANSTNQATSAEELRLARQFCPLAPNGSLTCVESEMDIALRHLERIPSSAPEYSEAMKLRLMIQKQEQELAAQHAKEQAEHNRLTHQSMEESRKQMWRNLQGQAHDPFTCSTSPNVPMISFDYGHHWWDDDGRCAARQQQIREASEQVAQEKQQEELGKRQAEQKARDSDAELNSYWPTTIRVDTDMDSFWLANEERTCQTYPDRKGRVEVVACNPGGSHRDHNIPVKFWGGVDRNTVSDWRCRRESDEFVCRAIN